MGTNVHFGNDVRQLKYEVLKGVAKLAYDDMLEEGKDDLPYQIIPGKEAKFRCCVYRRGRFCVNVLVRQPAKRRKMAL